MSDRACLLVLARIIVDDLQFADGRIGSATPGGAGLHAAAGASVWWPKIAIVAGVGADIHDVSHGLLLQSGFSEEGLTIRDPFTVRSKLVYLADGSRTETPEFGQAHFDQLETTASDIPNSLLPAAGIYIFQDTNADFWAGIRVIRPALGTILWELNAAAATPAQLRAIGGILPLADIFSINLSEGQQLFGDTNPDAMLDRLLAAGAPTVVLRMGAAGALAATPHVRLHVQPPPVRVVDETGGGNSFCGGFLASWCRKPDDVEFALRCAAASAACTIQQVGPAQSRNCRATDFAAQAVVSPDYMSALSWAPRR